MGIRIILNEKNNNNNLISKKILSRKQKILKVDEQNNKLNNDFKIIKNNVKKQNYMKIN